MLEASPTRASTLAATSTRFAPATPILVFVWSRTCGHSRRMDSLVDHFVRSNRDRVRLAKVEVSERPDLVERLGIEQAPAVVLLQGGREIARLEGRSSLPIIRDTIEPHLGIDSPTTTPDLALA